MSHEQIYLPIYGEFTIKYQDKLLFVQALQCGTIC